MKKIVLIALLINIGIKAQIKGNKNIITKTFKVENVTSIKVNLYAKVVIDQNLEEGLTITTDENLFDKISKEVVNGKLILDQKQWIEASQKIEITIGAPFLEKVEQGTHDKTTVIANTSKLRVLAPLGKIEVKGVVDELSIAIESGVVDASKLLAKEAIVNIWDDGKAIVYAENQIKSTIKNEGRLELVNSPKVLKGDTQKAIEKTKQIENSSIRWIQFKLKNNSWNRHHFFVIGPKQDGTKFSYGFALMPGESRQENWTTGTKVYKVNGLGLRKLITKIRDEDEGKVVKLFN